MEEDAESFFRLNSDPQVLRFVPDKALLNVEQPGEYWSIIRSLTTENTAFGRGA